MRRVVFIAIVILGSAACTGSNAGKTFVYALSEPPIGVLDASRCAADDNLILNLGIEDGLGFSVARGGQRAFLSTCQITESGDILDCGVLLPEIELQIDGEEVSGESLVRLEIQGDCEGADITLRYDMRVVGDVLTGTATATWALDNTLACELLESGVRRSSPSGLGVNGCVIDYPLSGVRLAECDFEGSGVCDYAQ